MATPNLSTGASIAQNAQRVTRGITQSMLNGNMVQPNNAFIARNSIGRLQFPNDLPEKYYFSLDVSNFSTRSVLNMTVNLTGTLTHHIKLPIPKQLVDTDNVQYEQQEIGVSGAAAAGALGTVANIGDIGGQITNITAASLKNFAGAALVTAINGVQNATGLNAMGGVQAALGVAPNQFLTVLLKGPAYKKHDFTWTLSPRSGAESENIRQIIYFLKGAMAVGRPNLGFFQAPKIFTPKFNKNDNYLYKFKPCVLESMSVNYTPSGAPAFYSQTGAPDTVELRLSFLEIEFWFAEDYAGSAGTSRF